MLKIFLLTRLHNLKSLDIFVVEDNKLRINLWYDVIIKNKAKVASS